MNSNPEISLDPTNHRHLQAIVKIIEKTAKWNTTINIENTPEHGNLRSMLMASEILRNKRVIFKMTAPTVIDRRRTSRNSGTFINKHKR